MTQLHCEFKNAVNTFKVSNKKVSGHYNMAGNHFHNYYEIYYLLSGERYYFIKDRTFYVTKGDLIFIDQYELHKTTDTGVPDHERVLIYFTEDFIMTRGGMLPEILTLLFKNGNPLVRLSLSGRNFVEDLFRKMLQEAQVKGTGYEMAFQALLMQFLVYMARYLEQNQTNIFDHPSPMHQKVSEVAQYINGHYSETLTLTFLSKRFFISPYYLSRIFKEVTGFSFIEYLNNIRIKEAQKLLRESRTKVITIAEKVGFGNVAHFGRVFKGITGQTPLQYRKQNG
ncbi:AraC-like protein [Hydrogenispora ethanolica]|uniref:AraC-like protein n=1 Tax=Hydrogenispora ethanolica TaxID=1082276 RepID=A0A4R1RI64_HYDET|nr:AraC family transcriptional regulator [Hydrogenispora ethanolica]TCL65332.1 AraC-like protein [Hydrogenispora ethanolica]